MFIRGACLFAAIFTLIGVATSMWGGTSCAIWWIDLRFLPRATQIGLEVLAVAALLVAAANVSNRRLRLPAAAVMTLLAAIAMANAIGVWRLQAEGRIVTSIPVPLSAGVAVLLAAVAVLLARAARPTSNGRLRRIVGLSAGMGTGMLAFPLAQMLFFGSTDYRSAVQGSAPTAVVVLGAGVRPDGSPSQALFDRVMTACRLYHERHVDLLVFSGGPGPSDTHETDAMRTLAIRQGIPDSAIVLDANGVDTEATAHNATRLLESRGIRAAIAVSHGYHVPRVKLAFRQQGVEVCTVPAEQSRTLAAMPFYVAREVPAIWVYWAKGLAGSTAGD